MKVNDGGWHHAVWVYDGSHLTAYLDGQPESTTAITGNNDNNKRSLFTINLTIIYFISLRVVSSNSENI